VLDPAVAQRVRIFVQRPEYPGGPPEAIHERPQDFRRGLVEVAGLREYAANGVLGSEALAGAAPLVPVVANGGGEPLARRRDAPQALLRLPGLPACQLLPGARLVELFGQEEVMPPDENLLQMATLIAGQVGQCVKRQQAEEERERLYQEVARERSFLQAVLEQMPAGILIADASGKVLLTNEQAERIYHQPIEPVKTIEEYGRWKVFDPEGEALPPERYPLARSLLDGEVVEGEEFGIPRGDGEKGVISVNAAPIRNRRGEIEAGVTAFNDVTKLKEAQEALAQSEERYRSLVTATSSIVWTSPDSGACTEEMPSWETFTGQTFEQYKGFGWLDAVHPGDRPPAGAWDHLSPEDTPLVAEYRLLRRDGEYRHVVSRGVPVLDENGEIREWVGTIEDITERKRAEEALRESEARYRTLFDSIDEGFCVIEMLFDENEKPADYRFLEINPAFEKHTGLERALGKRMRELAPRHEAHWFEIYGRVAQTGEPVRFENRAEALNRWFDVYAYRYGQPENRQVAILFSDITERKRAEEAVRESEERFRSIVAQTLGGVGQTDTTGRFVLVNDRFCKIAGYAREELMNLRMQDITHPDDLARNAELFERLVTEGVPFEIEKRYVRKDGSEVWVNNSVSALRDASGKTQTTVAIVIDVTERKRAEEERSRLANELRSLLESTGEGIFGVDLDGHCTFVNHSASRMLGYEPDEVLGRDVHALIHHSYPDGSPYPEEECPIHHAFKTGQRRRVRDEVLWRKDGSSFPAEYSSHPILEDGEIRGTVVTFDDITEIKKAEEEREQHLAREWRARAAAEERKRISRELHDRVAHAMGVVHQSLELYEALKERNLEAAGSRMELAREMTREALRYTRDLSNKLRNPEVENSLSSALSDLLSTAVPPNVEYEVRLEGDEARLPPRVREQLFLILREGVRNAVSHSGAKHLTIGVDTVNGSVTGYVEDDGRGFEAGASTGSPSGGIRSMRERTELLGGRFEVSSAPGAGARIEATVPLEDK
jgi:PAS domain S-box-containing protein